MLVRRSQNYLRSEVSRMLSTDYADYTDFRNSGLAEITTPHVHPDRLRIEHAYKGQRPKAKDPVISTIHFLNSFANAWRASVGAPEEVSRSTTTRAANSSHVLRALLFTIFAVIGLLHSKRAPGSKYVH